VKAKIEGGEVKRTEVSTKTSGEVVDLLAALQRSVDAAKTARGEDKDEEKAPAKAKDKAESKPKKKSPTKTAKKPAKKAAKKAS
jgi:DNA end-binding protein Ku